MTTPEVPGFDQGSFTHQGRTHLVYRAGAGPAVIVIHEIPGIHPGMLAFAQRLIAAMTSNTVEAGHVEAHRRSPRSPHPGRLRLHYGR